MIPTQFLRYEEFLKPADFQKIGELTLRWSLIDHFVGNCLKVLLRLTSEEAVTMVFPLSAGDRLDRIRALIANRPVSSEADFLFRELSAVMKAIQPVRNNLVHSILLWTLDGTQTFFHNRAKVKDLSKEEIFKTEDLTTYAAIAVLNLRFALGPKDHDPDEIPPPLPDRPDIPEFLRTKFQWPLKPDEAKPARRPPPSPL
jgi:hypothetical protein